MSDKSEQFSMIFDKKVSSGDTVKHEGRTMYITKIKSVEITEDSMLLVEGLWKEDQISKMMWKYTRNK